MDVGRVVAGILGAAVLAPLASFVFILLFGPKMGTKGKGAGVCATIAILVACILSMSALGIWVVNHPPQAAHHDTHSEPAEHAENGDAGHVADGADAHDDEPGETETDAAAHPGDAKDHKDDGHAAASPNYSYDVYTLGNFGDQAKMSISVYIDTLTVCMFAMVTLIATCIHFYATGYMHDELEGDEYVDHEVTMSDGSHLHRPGRYHRFFQAMSLFCFSMLGLVISGNIAMTFVFWELVGICSYFLIGFYVERKSASNAANKAFIVNRIGDFGMIIGLMALWASLGTFSFGGSDGIFAQVRPAGDDPLHAHKLIVPDGMVVEAAKSEVAKLIIEDPRLNTRDEIDAAITAKIPEWRDPEQSGVSGGYGRWLLIIAGVGIFCGCIGKSAQFPLHVWLPDAMEGPTPVSALVHSATMVAAGVFLVARFYPVFCPEVLFVIALVGCITLFLAATIAITATDIKRVLAYSTVSQLGYMMLALGIGGWLAGVMHLFTHAFFKSLLFMCSGSVIHAVHTNEMPEMGGLRKKMPWTAYTMLIGCMAIAGAGLPFTISLFGGHYHLGLSGFYSKDAIIEQALSFAMANSGWGIFFCAMAAGGAAITAFYMFRLWYLTFAGEPRNQHRYDHAHESPPVMYLPLVLLAVMAISLAWKPVEGMLGSIVAAVIFGILYSRSKSKSAGKQGAGTNPLFVALGITAVVFVVALLWKPIAGDVTLANLLEQARPAGTLPTETAVLMNMTWPSEPLSHLENVKPYAGALAFSAALAGFLLATAFYGLRNLDAGEAKQAFGGIHRFLLNKWWFDELYEIVFVKPTHFICGLASALDTRLIDGFLNWLVRSVRMISTFWERLADRQIVDGFVDGLASRTYRVGVSLKRVQTGRLRQYVVFIALGTIVVFVFATFVWNYAFAG